MSPEALADGRDRPATDPAGPGASDVVVSGVPTPLRRSRHPDIAHVVAAAGAAARVVRL